MFTPPPPYPKISELPPPGRERRRLLRQCGIAISQGDYAEEERSHLGTRPAPEPDTEQAED